MARRLPGKEVDNLSKKEKVRRAKKYEMDEDTEKMILRVGAAAAAAVFVVYTVYVLMQ